MSKLRLLGAACAVSMLLIFSNLAVASIIHTYDFGNTANGGTASGTFSFSSEGTPTYDGYIESVYGVFKATINGVYYDFDNLQPPGDGWTQFEERYLYDFTGTSTHWAIAQFERGNEVFSYSALINYFDEPDGLGIGAIYFNAGYQTYPNTELEKYSAEVSYLHTTSAVPIPAAAWLFGSGLLGLIGVARHKKAD